MGSFIHPLKTNLGDNVHSAEVTTGKEPLLDLQVLRPRCKKIKTFFTTIFSVIAPPSYFLFLPQFLGWLLAQELQTVANTEPN